MKKTKKLKLVHESIRLLSEEALRDSGIAGASAPTLTGPCCQLSLSCKTRVW